MRRLTLPVVAGLIVFLGTFGTPSAWAALKISPVYVDVRLDKGRPSGEFTITNVGDTEERYRINAQHFIFTRGGSLQKIEPDEHSLQPWLIFNPKEFTLPPNSFRTVRYTIAPKGRLLPGEYWGCMELESLNTTVASSTDDAGRKVSVQIQGVIIVPIFGQVGAIIHEGVLKDAHVKPVEGGPGAVEALVVNAGTGRLWLTGSYEITDASGASVAKGGAGRSYLLAGAERLFTSNLTDPLPAGKYTLRVEYTAPQLKEPLKQEVPFDWQPPPPVAPKPKPSAKPAASAAAPPPPPTPAPATPTSPAPAGT